ncbi:hypothetical protein B0H19DRAFT_1108807 [Mycena capillaripes]|nr:hypothetical protein B0H19DRAFT_1108807 [Mycena capillaripes]
MIAGVAPAPTTNTQLVAAPLPIAALHTLRITALECAPAALASLLRALDALCVLELDFSRVREPNAICDVLLETVTLPGGVEDTEATCECGESQRVPVLPRLEEARLFGLAGERVRALMTFRARFAEGFQCECSDGGSEYPPSSASSSCSSSLLSSSAPGTPADSTHTNYDSAGFDGAPSLGCAVMPLFVVRWSARKRERDVVLEQLVRQGRVGWVDEDEVEDADDDGNEDSSEDGHGSEGNGSVSEGEGGG